MPYLVLKSHHQEVERRALQATILVGRAPDCDWTIRDIVLSRRHCRFEQTPEGWTVTDLTSKNGTFINGQRIQQTTVLHDNLILRLGRSKLIFHAGELDENLPEPMLDPVRPADPVDALSGTLSGFNYLVTMDARLGNTPPHPHPMGALPKPLPRPRDPDSFENDDVNDLLTAIASSSWDSIYAEAQKSAVPNPAATDEEKMPRRLSRPRSPVDLSLQVCTSARSTDETAVLSGGEALLIPGQSTPAATGDSRVSRVLGRGKRRYWQSLRVLAASLWLLATFLIIQHFGGSGDRQAPAHVPNAAPLMLSEMPVPAPTPAVEIQPTAKPEPPSTQPAAPRQLLPAWKTLLDPTIHTTLVDSLIPLCF